MNQPTQSAPKSLKLLGWWRARHAYPLLALLCLMLWLPGIASLPALDRDESRFAQSSRQMLDSGNFVDIRFGQVPRYKKPVGIYWAQAFTTAIAGHIENIEGDHTRIWTYRLPSLLGGIAALWLICWLADGIVAGTGLLAALLMGFTILMTAEATIATTDAALLAAVMGAQGVLLRIYRAAKEEVAVSKQMVLWGWAALAIGILIKGPVAVGVTAATIGALLAWDWWEQRPRKADAVVPSAAPESANKKTKKAPAAAAEEAAKAAAPSEPPAPPPSWKTIFLWLKATEPKLGLPLLLLIVAPWLIAIGLQTHGAFFQQSLGNDFAAKLAGGQEGHGAPPGYNLLLSAVAFWPSILFLLPALGLAVMRGKDPAIRFLLAWAASWWLVCELVPTKLPQYVLPAYPALAILTALWLSAKEPILGRQRILAWIAALQFVIGLAGMVAAPIWLPRLYGAGSDLTLIGIAVAAGLIGLSALILFATGRRIIALSLAFASFFILVPTLTVGTGPGLTQLWMSERLQARVLKDRMPDDPPPALAGYEEPSLVFALGKGVNLTDGKGAATQGAELGGLALVDDFERSAFLARLAELQSDAALVDDVSGFNYSRGKKVHVTLYRVRKLVGASRPPHISTEP
jgi:4-amino-4-deoxy-L-arabinose transferase-like glycosyltransferase